VGTWVVVERGGGGLQEEGGDLLGTTTTTRRTMMTLEGLGVDQGVVGDDGDAAAAVG
jgi:hypothetical protein